MSAEPKTLQDTFFKILASAEQLCDEWESVIRTRLQKPIG